MPSQLFCIVGAGLAGGRAAAALRDRGFEGRLLLIGSETDPPYERPPLSKSYLSGELARDRLLLAPGPAYQDRAIEWRGGDTVSNIDRKDRRVTLADGETVKFDCLLLATGSQPKTMEVPGSRLEGVTTYRTLGDADALRNQLAGGPKVVVVGGGFLGSELAAAARARGCSVTIVEVGDALVAPLGALGSAYCAERQRQAGVELLLRRSVTGFLGATRVEQIKLDGGQKLACDLALICVGAAPNSALATRSGLATDPGVVVDQRCRTEDPAVFAAGDLASWWSPRWQRRLRVEHYDNAHQQGMFVAGAMLGDPAPNDPIPYFWTEQFGAMIQQVGVITGQEAQVVRGEPASGRFSVFYLEAGTVSGCVAVNRYPDLAAARRLIGTRVEVTQELLRDDSLDLRAWSRQAEEERPG